MRIEIDDKHQECLRARVAAGDYATIEEAVAAAIERMMLDDGPDEDDAWAGRLVEEGLAQLDRGESYSHEDVFAHIKGVIASSS